jgi:hypothetical protein
MTEMRRRSLLGPLETKPDPVPEDVIASAAERHGFAPPAAPAEMPSEEPQPIRRRRKSMGRTYQFNVRIRPETAAAIYDAANARNVPLALIIEEMLAAYERVRAR